MAHVNHNMKSKGAFARNGGKDRQANTRAGALKPGSALKPEGKRVPEHNVDGSVEGQAGAAFKDKGTFARNGGKYNQANQRPGAGNKQKRKWVPDHKVFEGSVGEGQGFAFRRKQKVQHEYNKLLRKERRKHAAVRTQYRDEYPDHLSHLYKAEAEKLYDDARTSRIKRTQCRMGIVVEEVLEDAPAEAALSTDTAAEPHASTDQRDPDTEQQGDQPAVTPDQTDSAAPQTQRSTPSEAYSLPMSNRQKKKLLKKTSFQKTKEEFESIQEKRAKKKEEFLKDKQQREEAIQKYKQKKKEAFKVLNTKTKKGQPNLNVQMEYLLQKIQGAGK